MLDTQSPGLFVRQNWMPLDGAFSIMSGTLAYAFARTVCSARQRYDIIFICAVFFRINFVFPHLFLHSLLQMCHRRRLVAYAHMQAVVVVEMDEARDEILHVLIRMQLFLPIKALHLYYTVGTLGNRIVRRLVVLAHGDTDLMRPEHSHVGIAAVLHSAVGVVDKPLENLAAGHRHRLLNGHLQRLH